MISIGVNFLLKVEIGIKWTF